MDRVVIFLEGERLDNNTVIKHTNLKTIPFEIQGFLPFVV